MELLWVRHGEPERIAPGRGVPADPPLTALGREQAQRLAAWLAPEPIDAVISSPLRRATETAAPIAAGHGLVVEVVDDLIEYDSKSDHYIPTEELSATKDERWLAMVPERRRRRSGQRRDRDRRRPDGTDPYAAHQTGHRGGRGLRGGRRTRTRVVVRPTGRGPATRCSACSAGAGVSPSSTAARCVSPG